MNRVDKIKVFVNYIIENVQDDGSILRIDLDLFKKITGSHSKEVLARHKYEAIASIDMPDNIIMEMIPVQGKLSNRMKKAYLSNRMKKEYGYRKIDNFSEYKLSEENFRKLTNNDIKTITDVFSRFQGIGKRQIMIIMFIIDVLATKPLQPAAWLRIKQGYLSSYFMIPQDIIHQYVEIMKKGGILIEAIHPCDDKPVYRLNLECARKPMSANDFLSTVVGYSYPIALKLTSLLNDKKQIADIDICDKHDIIYENDIANDLHNSMNDEPISRAIAALSDAVNSKVDALEAEVADLRAKIKDYDASSKAFQALNEQYQEAVKRKEEVEESYISPKKMENIKKTLAEKTSSVLNKLSSDIMIQLAEANNAADINALRTNAMCLVMDSTRAVANYVKNMERFADASHHNT